TPSNAPRCRSFSYIASFDECLNETLFSSPCPRPAPYYPLGKPTTTACVRIPHLPTRRHRNFVPNISPFPQAAPTAQTSNQYSTHKWGDEGAHLRSILGKFPLPRHGNGPQTQ